LRISRIILRLVWAGITPLTHPGRDVCLELDASIVLGRSVDDKLDGVSEVQRADDFAKVILYGTRPALECSESACRKTADTTFEHVGPRQNTRASASITTNLTPSHSPTRTPFSTSCRNTLMRGAIRTNSRQLFLGKDVEGIQRLLRVLEDQRLTLLSGSCRSLKLLKY